MTKRYRQIALSDATDGMILSDAVLDTRGNILLPQGTVLTASMLVSLERHQIETVAIAGAPISAEAECAEHAQRLARVARLFRQSGAVPGSPPPVPVPAATGTLHQYILNFRAGAAS